MSTTSEALIWASDSQLTLEEEQFLQAVLWEEGRLRQGPALQAVLAHDLSMIRCLEPANRLSPNLHGEALNRVRPGSCPPVQWPWPGLTGDDVLQLLWQRLAKRDNLPESRLAIQGRSLDPD